jgi:hypothetical protein
MPDSYQIALSDAEKGRLVNRIELDFLEAKSAHLERTMRFARYLQHWENRVDPPSKGDELKPNMRVPLTQWQVFNKIARDLQALIGDDAEITARPTGPSDADLAQKVGAYMTSRMFDQMEILNPLCVYLFQRILYGRAIAYRPWYRREFDWLENGVKSRVCDYEGPGFVNLLPDDIMTPGERGVQSIHDFSYCIRRVRVTVDELQRGDGNLYQGTSSPEFVKRALGWAQTGWNDYTLVSQDPVRTEQERNEGIAYDNQNFLSRRGLWVWEWYGKWRPLRRQTDDAPQDDIDLRLPFEADWVVKMIPGLREIIGCQDLLELYPRMRKRRPFCETSLIKDGTYWSQGFGSLLESLEDEASANSQLLTAAGELSVWPIIFYKLTSGMKPKKMTLEPGACIPTEDPGSVNVINLRPNLEYSLAKQQDTLAMAERVTGITDQSLGRSIDRPNAPRTATGQLALIEEGNVRAYLDSTVLREDMEQMIADFWYMDCDLIPRINPDGTEYGGIWFRVTESANAPFDTRKGGAYMTPKEFGGRYDFRLKFATSAFSREAQAQKTLSFYSLAAQNPIVMQNPRANWVLLNRTAKALGILDFNSVIPEPPDLDEPISPDLEWTKMLEGDQNVQPNPMDNDQMHMMIHMKQLAESKQDRDPDIQAENFLIKHIIETRQQIASKQAMQALTQSLIQSIQPGGAGPGGTPGVIQPGGPPPGFGAPPGGMPPPPGGPPGAGVPAPPENPPPNNAGGYIMPSQHVGSSAAPVAQNGML